MASDKSFVHYISYKKNQREMELYMYVEKQSCKSDWVKRAIEEKMEREINTSKQSNQANQINMSTIPMFNDSFM